mgnify:CR=1 FL=1
MGFYNFILNLGGLVLFAIIALAIILPLILHEVEAEISLGIKDYFEERERQKTARKLLEVQKEREALGVAEDKDLLEDEDIDLEDVVSEDELKATEKRRNQ